MSKFCQMENQPGVETDLKLAPEQHVLDPVPAAFTNYRLYLGSAKHARDLSLLRKLNVRSILNMTWEIPYYFPDSFAYTRIPLSDSSMVTRDVTIERRKKIFTAIRKIAEVITNPFGGNILVHCAAGSATKLAWHVCIIICTYKNTQTKLIMSISVRRRKSQCYSGDRLSYALSLDSFRCGFQPSDLRSAHCVSK